MSMTRILTILILVVKLHQTSIINMSEQTVSQVELGFGSEVILRCTEDSALPFLMNQCFANSVNFTYLSGAYNNAVREIRERAPQVANAKDVAWTGSVRRLFREIKAVEQKIRIARIVDFPLLRIGPMLPTEEFVVPGAEPPTPDTFIPLTEASLTDMGDSQIRSKFPNGLINLSVVVDFGCTMTFDLNDVPTQNL